MARANGGIYEPEFRIIANILAFLTLSIGWFVFMWLLDHPTPTGYYAGAVCHACIIFGVTVTSTTGALYILFVVPLMSFLVQLLACGDVQLTLFKTDSDSFGKYATEMFILQMTTKNLLFFMFSKFINAWEIRVGGSHVMKVLGIASMALLATSIPMCMYFFLPFHSDKKISMKIDSTFISRYLWKDYPKADVSCLHQTRILNNLLSFMRSTINFNLYPSNAVGGRTILCSHAVA